MSLEASWSRSSKINGASAGGGGGGAGAGASSESYRKDSSSRGMSSNRRGESDRRSHRDDRDHYRYSSRSRYSRSRDRISRDRRSSSRKRDDRISNRRQNHHHRSRSRSPSSHKHSSSSSSKRRGDKYESRRHNHERRSSGGGGGGGGGSSGSVTGDIGDSREERKQQNDNIRILRASRSLSKSKSPESHKLKSGQYKMQDNNLDYLYKSDRSNSTTKIINSLDDDFDKERIHKEMQERLIEHLAREGKVYPPPKPQPASHPIFANDGSFLETFKKLQEQQQWTSPELDIRGIETKPAIHQLHPHHLHHHHHHHQQQSILQSPHLQLHHPHHLHQQQQQQMHQPPQYHHQPPPQPVQPVFGKRRGGKILKTGVVQKPKIIEENASEVNQNDAWAMYLQEVKKYKNVSCDADSKTRPLVK